MNRLVNALLRVLPISWRSTVEQDLDDDARSHGRGTGWRLWEAARIVTAWRWSFGSEAIATDLKHGVRSLVRTPWFTIAAVLTFALGIGVNVAVFSAIDRLLFRSLPYAQPERLVLLRSCPGGPSHCGGAFPAAVAYRLRQQSDSFVGIEVGGLPELAQWGTADPERVTLLAASPGALQLLGVRPSAGRDISESEIASKTSVIWLSDEYWHARFNRDPSVIGRSLWAWTQPPQLAGTVIGILPAGFVPPSAASLAPDWRGVHVEYTGWTDIGPGPGSVNIPFARLKPGVTLTQARAEVAARAREAVQDPKRPPLPLRVDSMDAALFGFYLDYLWLVALAAGLVLLMACANLASLFLVRGRSREQVWAVCRALGATRGRLLATALVESFLVCSAGALVAFITLGLTGKAIEARLPLIFQRYSAGLADARVVVFSLVVTLGASILAGALPEWRSARRDVLPVLQRGGRGAIRRLRGGRGLLVAESAVGTLLVFACVLSVKTLWSMTWEDLGFQPQSMYLVDASFRQPKQPRQPELEQLLQVMSAMPGVQSVGAADFNPASRSAPARGFSNTDRRGIRVQATPGYFAATGLRLLAGRLFDEQDLQAADQVVIMNRSGLALAWPGCQPPNAIGRVWSADGEAPRKLIGVVDDMKFAYGEADARAISYVPLGAEPTRWGTISVRMASGQTLDQRGVSAFVQAQMPSVRVAAVSQASRAMASVLEDPKFRASLLTTFAVTALLLAAVGLYAVASFESTLRRHEMGVRLTLGATPTALRRMILLDTARPTAVGAAIGLALCWWAGNIALSSSFWYRTGARDPWLYLPVVTVLVLTGALAGWWPARDAGRTEPAEVLRAQ